MRIKFRIARVAAIAVAAVVLGATAFFTFAADEAGPENKAPEEMRGPDVVFVGTPYDLISQMLKMAQVKKSDVVYDLGCGDARILVLAAQKYGTKAVGYDIDPERVIESRANVAKNQVQDLVKIIQADIFTLDLRPADVMPLYLHPDMMAKLVPQLEKMKPGSRIVCHEYGLPDEFVPDKTLTVTSNEDNAQHHLMLYTIPLKRN